MALSLGVWVNGFPPGTKLPVEVPSGIPRNPIGADCLFDNITITLHAFDISTLAKRRNSAILKDSTRIWPQAPDHEKVIEPASALAQALDLVL